MLVEQPNKGAPYFGTYDIVKSRVNTDRKIDSSMKKKNKIIKKLKSQLGINYGEKNVEEVEEEGPLAITQGIGEDAEMAEQETKEEAK